jgi:hypothetical protein
MPAIIKTFDELIDETDSAVKLAQYAQIVGLSEDGFFGLNNSATADESCHPIWTLRERTMVARYLKEAQQEIEQVTTFPLTPRWITDETKYFGFPMHTNWTKLIEAGFKNTAMIKQNAVPSFATDPAVIIAATVFTDEAEIAVFHPGTDIEIYPSSVSISGGNVTIEIPWARMVKQSKQDNSDSGLTYSDVTNYEATVDVKRVYNDHSIEGGLKWLHQAGPCCGTCLGCCNGCSDYTENACVTIRNAETGAVDLSPASYFATGWTANCSTCFCEQADLAIVNYRAGIETTAQIQDAVVRLAHSKMPVPPCGCGIAQDTWTRDRKIPDVLDAKRLDCDFGTSEGAWFAWRQAQAIRVQRARAMG